MEIKKLIEEAHKNAKEKGWHDEERSFGELIALCHSELSEALEEYRAGNETSKILYECKSKKDENCFDYPWKIQCDSCHFGKPVGIPIELADVVIRIADLCGHYYIDLDKAIKIKMEYNKTRSYKHGNKVI